MPKKSFPLEPGSSRTVDVEWKGIWKNFTVTVDGQTLGTLHGTKEMHAGGQYALPDGSRLEIKLTQGMSPELQVTRDGAPLPGSASDPAARLKTAAGIAFFIAGLNIVLGVVAEVGNIQFLQMIGIGLFSVFFGAVFLGLGLGIRKGSVVALILAIAIFAIDGVVSLGLSVQAGGRIPVGAVVFRVLLLIPLIKAVSAAKQLKDTPTRLDDTAGGGATGMPVSVPLSEKKD